MAFSFYKYYTQLIGFDVSIFSGLLLCSVAPVKPRRLTKLERSQIELPENLKEIMVGHLLGDLFIQSRGIRGNTRLFFAFFCWRPPKMNTCFTPIQGWKAV
jgi:hypothetical protein